jgi:hypothetical protein
MSLIINYHYQHRSRSALPSRVSSYLQGFASTADMATAGRVVGKQDSETKQNLSIVPEYLSPLFSPIAVSLIA